MVPVPFENGLRQRSNHFIIFHKQNGFGAAEELGRSSSRFGQLGCLLDSWKINLKGRAFAQLAIDPDVPAALFDNPVDGGQAQAGPASQLLSW